MTQTGPRREAYRADALLDCARLDTSRTLQHLGTHPDGLHEGEASLRLRRYGPNEVLVGGRRPVVLRILDNLRNPLIILLMALGVISYLTGDIRATIMIGVMVVLGVVLRFVQEMRSDKAVEKLKALVAMKATVIRDGEKRDVPVATVVPGDIILLSAGDMVPADVRLLAAHDLYMNESALTGESMPVEKREGIASGPMSDPLGLPMLCFQGSHVQTGSATAVAVLTGADTYFGRLAESISGERAPTGFDAGINAFTWLIIRFMMVLVPLVFVVNGLSKGNWLDAFLFALAVAVGMTPEMLPMIVTVNLSKGAIAMSRRKVIVKRLNAIQDLGAMDVLCTDKTGTLTEGRIVLIRHVDVEGNEREEILHYAFLNSYFETGLKNVMDVAVLEHEHLEETLVRAKGYTKIDEIPFDFERRRLSVVVDDAQGERTLICKGAVEEMVAHCSHIMVRGEVLPLDSAHHYPLSEKLVERFNEQGFRVVALAFRTIPRESRAYTVADESDLTLMGYLAFLDPPKESAANALRELHQSNISVKVLTGDNGVITGSICRQVGLPVEGILLGSAINLMNDEQLAGQVESNTIFAKLSPVHKERVIKALQHRGHVVGCMGDGINDAPALKWSDVGISVDTAVDIAKESSDIILLERSLLVLNDGVIEGRRVFGNVIKYIKMAASSNFGNMLSVIGASIFLPFLPMLPIQVLTNNLLYDLSQTTIPTDDVDAEWLARPRTWAIGDIRRFILRVGPVSSIFDYATFFIMLSIFNCWSNPALFHTGWFIESLFTQTLIIHVIRTDKIPLVESRASTPLIITSLLIVAFGSWLPYSPLAGALGLVALPWLYWVLLGVMLVCYVALTQSIKNWLLRKESETDNRRGAGIPA